MQARTSLLFTLFFVGAFPFLMAPNPALATIEWVAIGDPGNAPDSQPQGSFGAVGYDYSISKFETTNAEYTLFLNAKAASDPLGLYSTSMESDTAGGIMRMGTSGNYSYLAKSGFENKAVNFVTFFDALRYANWVENGEGNGDTETGAYTLLGDAETPSNGSTVVRNPGAEVVLPTRDEWFKAAYYDGFIDTYYDYPAGSDTAPDCTSPTATPNSANCGTGGVTDVGAYTGSPGPYGTFDQGGNVAEWSETVTSSLIDGRRAVWGGGWTRLETPLKASSGGSVTTSSGSNDRGFRLALLSASGPDAMVIEEISITSGPAYSAGEFSDYFIDPIVTGTGIGSVVISSVSGGFDQQLFEVTPGEFSCEQNGISSCDGFPSLSDITALGDLIFIFFGNLGENDFVVIPLADYDPGSGESGLPSVVSPVNGATGVATDATLEWTAPPLWVHAIAVGIEDLASGETPDEVTFFGDPPLLAPASITTWAPSGMVNGASYVFELSYFHAIQFEEPRITDQARIFLYTSAFESFNESFFAVPEPGSIVLNAVALSVVFGITRLRRRSHSKIA